MKKLIYSIFILSLIMSCASSMILVPIDEVPSYERGMKERGEEVVRKDTLRGYDSKMVKIIYRDKR